MIGKTTVVLSGAMLGAVGAAAFTNNHIFIDAFPSDPKCDPAAGDPRVRFVLTPDPLLDVPVAAAAWGWTYKADCVDPATLSQFAKDHYDQGTEEICVNGQSVF